MKKIFGIVALAIAIIAASCTGSKPEHIKVHAWMGIRGASSDSLLESYFQHASDCGIDAIFLECHSGIPSYLGDSSLLIKSAALASGLTTAKEMAAAGEDTSWIHDPAIFRDSAAIDIMTRAAVFAKKYGIELHAWMWTANRGEMLLRNLHKDWYAINGLGESTADIKLYNREHYRFLCPNHDGVTEYLKARAREIAEIDGVAGVHMDFIRYPDAILPYGLHESRGVVQDKVYPTWDFCYCDVCRNKFKEQTGIDPLELEDPTANEEWMEFRWSSLAEMTSEIAAEIKACGKISSAAVFASPEESKKLVRQDWVNFRNVDILMPMIYNRAYAFPDEWIETATREGVEGLKANNNPAVLRSGMALNPRMGIDTLYNCAECALKGGSDGICIFSLDAFARREEGWDMLKELVTKVRSSENFD